MPNSAAAKSILVIDDDIDVAESMCLVFSNAGFNAVCALGGEEGIARIQRDRYDVIVTDMFMPDVDGMRVIDVARNCQPPPRIVAVSGGSRYGAPVSALEKAQMLGASATLAKPFTARELIGSVEQHD